MAAWRIRRNESRSTCSLAIITVSSRLTGFRWKTTDAPTNVSLVCGLPLVLSSRPIRLKGYPYVNLTKNNTRTDPRIYSTERGSSLQSHVQWVVMRHGFINRSLGDRLLLSSPNRPPLMPNKTAQPSKHCLTQCAVLWTDLCPERWLPQPQRSHDAMPTVSQREHRNIL